MSKANRLFNKVVRQVIGSGKIFTIEFKKVDGSNRRINGKNFIKKELAGGSLPFDKNQRGIVNFYSFKDKGFRSCRLQNIKEIRCGGKYATR